MQFSRYSTPLSVSRTWRLNAALNTAAEPTISRETASQVVPPSKLRSSCAVALNVPQAETFSTGRAFISVNKALVTQASSAIPVVPLYISILYKVMKEAGTHEGCIEQMQRLFATQLYNGNSPKLDSEGRVRVDDWEMRPEIQQKVSEIWPKVTTENLAQLTDIAGYRTEFLKLFGFGLPGVNYDAEVEPHEPML